MNQPKLDCAKDVVRIAERVAKLIGETKKERKLDGQEDGYP